MYCKSEESTITGHPIMHTTSVHTHKILPPMSDCINRGAINTGLDDICARKSPFGESTIATVCLVPKCVLSEQWRWGAVNKV